MRSETLYAEARELEERAKKLRDEARAAQLEELAKKPLFDRLIFSAGARCVCGLGLAYDPAGVVGSDGGPFKKPAAWECSGVLLGEGDGVQHDEPLPFAFYDIKSENQPSARGATTRPVR